MLYEGREKQRVREDLTVEDRERLWVVGLEVEITDSGFRFRIDT